MNKKKRVMVRGVLPPPYFGHSVIHQVLMKSVFADTFEVIFFHMKFWSYKKHKKVTALKLLKMIKYYFQFIGVIIFRRPQYVLYGISFDKMPFLKDFLFCMTARLLGCRVVLHDMGQYAGILYQSSPSFGKRLVRMLMGHIKATIVLGNQTKKSYEGLLGQEKIFAVPAAVGDTRHFSMPPTGDSASRIDVLYFSFLSRSKGVLVALKAAARVIKEDSQIHFNFVGPLESESLKDEIEKFIRDHNISNNVHLFGYEDDEFERSRFFRQSDIFIFPTLRDVFLLFFFYSIVESIPVIASREGTIPEIVEEGKIGFLFD